MQASEQGVWKTYQNPATEKLSLKQALEALLDRVRDLLPFVRPGPGPFIREKAPKVYDRPQLRQLTSVQASLILFGHSTVGNPAARELLGIVFPEQRPCEWPGRAGPTIS